MDRPLQITLIGSAESNKDRDSLAFGIGCELAARGATLICGGRGGVMAAGCRGSHSVGGITVGILPEGKDDPSANAWLSVVVATGVGQARNLAVVLSGDAVIAVGGGWGTLSEIALARKHGIPVVLLQSWSSDDDTWCDDPGLLRADDPAEAVRLAIDLVERYHSGT